MTIVRNRIRLQDVPGSTSVEVEPGFISFQADGGFISIGTPFFLATLEAFIEVSGSDPRKIVAEQLAEETRRRNDAEARVRALEGQLAAFRKLIEPKIAPKYADQED